MDHGSNAAFSREIFWDHRSDFGIHGHVWKLGKYAFHVRKLHFSFSNAWCRPPETWEDGKGLDLTKWICPTFWQVIWTFIPHQFPCRGEVTNREGLQIGNLLLPQENWTVEGTEGGCGMTPTVPEKIVELEGTIQGAFLGVGMSLIPIHPQPVPMSASPRFIQSRYLPTFGDLYGMDHRKCHLGRPRLRRCWDR